MRISSFFTYPAYYTWQTAKYTSHRLTKLFNDIVYFPHCPCRPWSRKIAPLQILGFLTLGYGVYRGLRELYKVSPLAKKYFLKLIGKQSQPPSQQKTQTLSGNEGSPRNPKLLSAEELTKKLTADTASIQKTTKIP